MPQEGRGFGICDIVLPAKLRGFPYNSPRDTGTGAALLPRVSIRRVFKKIKNLVLHTCSRAMGSSIKIKYLLIFSANTPNLQWLELGLASAQELCTQSLPPSWLGWEEKTLHHLLGKQLVRNTSLC